METPQTASGTVGEYFAAAVRQVDVTLDARAFSRLPRIDYADAFIAELASGDERTSEQLARAMLEDAPLATRATLTAGWTSLGLRMGSPWSAEFVLGWTPLSVTSEVLLLGAGSRLGLSAELLFRREPGRLLLSTFVRLANPAARAMWAAAEPAHPPIVKRLLERVSRSSEPPSV
jgi:hypothetical protein